MRHFRFLSKKAASGRLFAFFVLALFALSCLATAAPARAEEARVRFVPDGDTLILADGRVVRLAAIDAPETAKESKGRRTPAQFYAEEAAALLRSLVLGKAVEIYPAGQGADRHGRMVADVRLSDGRLAQDVLVSQGAAFVYPHADTPPRRIETLLALQRQAIVRGAGFWPHVLFDPANKIIWTGNAKSLRFGPEKDCKPLQSMAPGRRVAFGSLREAFWEGFAPYRECRSPFTLQN